MVSNEYKSGTSEDRRFGLFVINLTTKCKIYLTECRRGVIVSSQEEIIMENNKSLSGKIKCVLICLGIVVLMLLVQAIGIIVPLLPKASEFMKESGGDILKAREIMGEYVKSNVSLLATLMMIGEIAALAVAGIWYYFGFVKPEKARKAAEELPKEKEKLSGLKKFGFMFCGFLATWGLAAVLSRILSQLFPQTSQDLSEVLGLLNQGSVVLTLLIISLLAPIFEEFTVRGIILGKLKKYFGPVGCIVISAILFGIFHLNIIQGIYVLPMGLFWGFLAYKYKSVIPGIICHMANNFFGGILTNLVNPLIVFIVFGAITAFIGVKCRIFDLSEKKTEDIINVEEN